MEEERIVRPKLDPSFGFSPNVLASVAEAVNKIKNALQENQQKGYTSVTDAAFTARLEKAMQKNFDYIRRKDQGLVSGPKTGPRVGSSTYANKAPTRLGIGSTAVPPPPPPTSAAHAASTGAAAANRNYSNASAASAQESTSVYVSKLPTDISEEELEILFGALGRIKKVKIYTTALGKQKGDALVTFALVETAITACFKFNNLDIGDGHVISVVRAEFNSSTSTAGSNKGTGNNALPSTADNVNILMDADGDQPMLGSTLCSKTANGSQGVVDRSEQGFHSHFVHSTSTFNDIGSRAQSSSTANALTSSNAATTTTVSTPNTIANSAGASDILYTLLPAETEVGSYPVVLILNAFDPTNAHDDDPSFFDEMETDMLLECCGFGKVRTIQLLTLPPNYLSAVATASSSGNQGRGGGINMQGVLGGAIGVTFELVSDAERCAAGLRDRRFDGRVLKTFVLPPRAAAATPPFPMGSCVINNSEMAMSAAVPPPPPPPPPRPPSVPKPAAAKVSQLPTAKAESVEPNIEAISNDVDDFLSSLL